jgi:hypothetical protein
MHFIKDWWDEAIPKNGKSNKVRALLVMLVSYKIWKERNVHVFRNHASNSTLLVSKIKDEEAMWSLAGAKGLCNVMTRE